MSLIGLAIVLCNGLVATFVDPYGGFAGVMGKGPAQLIQLQTVQSDLKLSDDQIKKIKEWLKEFLAKQRDRLKEFADLPERERLEKIISLRKEIRETVYKILAEILTKEQLDRLKQIERQIAGVFGVLTEESSKALKLTDAQKSAIERDDYTFEVEVMDKYKQEITNAKEYNVGWEKLVQFHQSELDKILNNNLTSEQKTAWKELCGKPIDQLKLFRELDHLDKNKQKK